MIERHTPTARLQPFIREYLFIESETEMYNTVLPDTSIVLAIRYSGEISIMENGKGRKLPNLVLSGIRKSSRKIHYSQRTGNLLVQFNPGGAGAFFSTPLNELLEQSLPADCLDNHSGLRNLPEQIAAQQRNSEKIGFLEQFLVSRLIKPAPDPLLSNAIDRIRATHGSIPIRTLSGELYISQDAFEKRFRQAVGTSPKHFSSIIRFRYAIQTHSARKSLTDTGLTAGYYDQAHFIKDFNRFTGQSPREFFSSGPHW